jgi:hypothetical protein
MGAKVGFLMGHGFDGRAGIDVGFVVGGNLLTKMKPTASLLVKSMFSI